MKITGRESDNLPVFGMWEDHDDSKDEDSYIRHQRKGRFDDNREN